MTKVFCSECGEILFVNEIHQGIWASSKYRRFIKNYICGNCSFSKKGRKLMEAEFATYEKNIESKVIQIRHTIRIKLNSNRRNIEDALKNVPYNAIVSMIIDDTDLGDYGEIHFLEEKGE